MNIKRISVRLEGGLGDCLLGARFIPAIKELYPNAEITAFIDSEGKTFQKEVLSYLYPSLFKELTVIPTKKHKELWINSQFGEENMIGFIENVPAEYMRQMISYDIFYDLHVDSLKFTNYDFNWASFFKRFPKPEISAKKSAENKYICLHLASDTSNAHVLQQWYIDSLITELLKLNIKLKIISTLNTNYKYKNFLDNPNIQIINEENITKICDLILNSSGFIGVDSGFKYIGYAGNIPTLTLSKNCEHHGGVPPSHYLRWLPFKELTFCLHFDSVLLRKLMGAMIEKPELQVLPELITSIDNLDNILCRRKYTVDLNKTK